MIIILRKHIQLESGEIIAKIVLLGFSDWQNSTVIRFDAIPVYERLVWYIAWPK
jgi:hypothetical protein